MVKKRRKFSARFKAKVALATLREDASITELSAQYGVHAVVISRWKKEALESMQAGFAGKLEKQSDDHEKEVKCLHQKIGQLNEPSWT